MALSPVLRAAELGHSPPGRADPRKSWLRRQARQTCRKEAGKKGGTGGAANLPGAIDVQLNNGTEGTVENSKRNDIQPLIRALGVMGINANNDKETDQMLQLATLENLCIRK